MTGSAPRVPGAAGDELARLTIAHATLRAGPGPGRAGDPVSPGAASLLVSGRERHGRDRPRDPGRAALPDGTSLHATDSIIDANAPDATAYCAPDGTSAGGEMSLNACTVIGRIRAGAWRLVSNCLLLARAARRRHAAAGAMRCAGRRAASASPSCPSPRSRPGRYRCQPESAEGESERRAPLHLAALRRAPPIASSRAAAPTRSAGAPMTRARWAPSTRCSRRSARPICRFGCSEFLRVGLSSGVFYEN